MKKLLKPTLATAIICFSAFSVINLQEAKAECAEYSEKGAKNRLLGGCKTKAGFTCVIIRCEKEISIDI